MASTSTREGHDQLANRVSRLFDEQMRAGTKARRAGDVVPTVHAITVEWLNDVLREHLGAARVTAVAVEDVSSGTHARHRLRLEYDDAAKAAGLPATLFTKSLPDVQTRMIAGVTGHARTEGNFYMQLRPELEGLEIPRGYYSAFDRESFAAVNVLEDVSSTRGATFCDWRTKVSRANAEDQVDLLAGLHGHFYADPRLETDEFRWVTRFERWFLGGIAKLRVDYYNDMAFTQAADLIPGRLLKRREEVWPATLAALQLHEQSPRTFLHSDVHIGNWYQTAAGRMGLCDWQCAARGHFSRDLAYVLSAALEIDDRRAWERELVRRYTDRLATVAGRAFDADVVFRNYRHQMLHALLMWTPTLCHSEHLPDMQPEAASLCMIERMTAAIDDLDSLDVLAG